MKTEPISFRPSRGLDARLNAMQGRTGISKGRLVELLADEAERSRRYPGLAFRGPDHRRRAWAIASHFDVWEIIQAWQDFGKDDAKTQKALGLSAPQLRLALAYYREFPEEIDAALALARRPMTELQSGYPFIESLTLRK